MIYTVTLKNDEDISLENSSAMISAKYGHSLKLRSIGNHEYTCLLYTSHGHDHSCGEHHCGEDKHHCSGH